MNPALAKLAATPTPATEAKAHPHAVENGVIRHLSVSQVKDFDAVTGGCERVWWFSKVLHLPKKQFKSQQIGIEGHAQIEHYLPTGENVLGAVALAGKHLLPEPGKDLLVEASIAEPPLTAAGIPFQGYIDLVNARRQPEGVLRITDHKFTKSIEKYAAKSWDLVSITHGHGIQMIGYARWAVLSGRFPWARTLELEHLYYQTQGPKRAQSVIATVPAQSFDGEWKRIDDVAERMKAVAHAKSLADVRPNWSACEAYGGCSFKAQCLTFNAPKEHHTMGIMNLLNKTAGASASVPPPPPAAATPPPAEPKPSRMVIIDNSGSGFAAKLAKLAKPGAKYVLPDKRTGTFLKTVDTGGEPLFAFDVGAARPALLDPEELITFAPEPVKTEPTVVYDPGQAPATPTTTAPVEVAQTTATPAPAAEEKPKRTRRTKEQIAADEAAEGTAPATFGPQLRVLVDAVVNGPTESLTLYVAGIVGQMQTAFEVDDIRCAPSKRKDGSENPLAFGKWKGVLAAAIRAEPPKPATYSALGVTASEIGQVAIEALEPMCGPGNFIRGVR